MSPGIYLPSRALRALHSGYVDYLLTLPEPLRDAFITRTNGLTFERFLLGLQARMLAVTVRAVGEHVYLGLAVPAEDGNDLALFEITGTHAGVTADYVIKSVSLDLDRELAELLGGAS